MVGSGVCHTDLVVRDQVYPVPLPAVLGHEGAGIVEVVGDGVTSVAPGLGREAPAGSSIAVFGTGSVGMSAVMASVVAGCTTIVAVDLHAQRLQQAEGLGATHGINASGGGVVARVQEITGGAGVDFAIETTGVPGVLRQAVDSLGFGGTCGHLGSTAPGTDVCLDMGGPLFGRSVRGIVQGDSVPGVFIPRLVDLFKRRRFPIDKLITSYPFEEINTAAEDSEKGVTLKPVLTFG